MSDNYCRPVCGEHLPPFRERFRWSPVCLPVLERNRLDVRIGRQCRTLRESGWSTPKLVPHPEIDDSMSLGMTLFT
jgi:hypothetical protein